MNTKHIAGAASAILMASVGFVSAQTTTPTSTPLATSTPSSYTTPALGITVSPTPVVRPGTGDAILALITVSAERSNSGVQIQSLPVSMSFGGGLTAGQLTDCVVRNLTSLSSSLTASGASPSQGLNTFTLTSPLQTDVGRTTTLVLTCDVATTAPIGGTILISVTPSTVAATVNGSSTTVTPTTGFTPNGSMGSTSGSVLISSATTPTPTPTTPGPAVPGVPNTGIGENNNLMILAASALAIILGAMLLRRRVV